jgi:hypothetical protein
LAWLRLKGVDNANPLHTLRKEFGSEMNRQHGIHAASSSLRHAGIGITALHYVDKRSRVTVGLGGLLKAKSVAIDRKKKTRSPGGPKVVPFPVTESVSVPSV